MRIISRIWPGLVLLILASVASHYVRQQYAQRTEDLRGLFQLPQEAVIFRVNDAGSRFSSGTHIEFKLPSSRTSDRWLEFMAERQVPIGLSRCWNNPLAYDSGSFCNFVASSRIEYVPARGIYRATYWRAGER